jgi:hypothetical protein
LRVGVQVEAGDDAEIVAAAAEGVVEVAVGAVVVDIDNRPVRGDDLEVVYIVAGPAVVA